MSLCGIKISGSCERDPRDDRDRSNRTFENYLVKSAQFLACKCAFCINFAEKEGVIKVK